MHSTSLAPLLSATRRRVSCWIIGAPLLGPLDDLEQAPALVLGQRAGLHDADAVALAGVVDLVMADVALGARHGLAVARVGLAGLDLHDDGLVHLRGGDDALADLAAGPLRRTGVGLGCRHAGQPSAVVVWAARSSAAVISRLRASVRQRATSRFTWAMRPVLVSWPVAFWKRRLKSSSRASARRVMRASSSRLRTTSLAMATAPPRG